MKGPRRRPALIDDARKHGLLPALRRQAQRQEDEGRAPKTGDTTINRTSVVGSGAIRSHGPSSHTEGTAWRLLYLDANGDETELVLGADGTVLASAGASAAPVMEEIYVSHPATFIPDEEDLDVDTLNPRAFCVGESGEHGTLTAIRAKAIAGTAGVGTNTILIEADDNPAFSSATVLFTLALNTSTEVDDATLDNTWAAGDIWVRARCSAVGGTAPKNVVVQFFYRERAEAF